MNINEAFKSVCKVLFKRELGELQEFENYLRTYNEKVSVAKSVSGKDIHYTAPYSKGARFVDYPEAFGKSADAVKSKPINADDIKDIDSLANAAREICYYSGNKVIGKSEFVEKSENIADSSVVYSSSEILRCEYVAYSSLLRDSKYMFGSSCLGESGFCINVCENNNSQRCFETDIVFFSSDCYYSNNCKSSHEMLFCFDQRSKSNMVGNNQLEKSQYLKLKEGLIEQMAGELESKKRLPSLLDLLQGGS
ncbi:MAG: hypothetical protein WCT31_00150 [Candidatus Micrarchaeia archaeon]|jgi:hypothetical protein